MLYRAVAHITNSATMLAKLSAPTISATAPTIEAAPLALVALSGTTNCPPGPVRSAPHSQHRASSACNWAPQYGQVTEFTAMIGHFPALAAHEAAAAARARRDTARCRHRMESHDRWAARDACSTS